MLSREAWGVRSAGNWQGIDGGSHKAAEHVLNKIIMKTRIFLLRIV